ncbi:MAG TPA: hypothetical protein VKE51_26300 [Vicinamibacterales bacterium]|nr:hypothetical protein [Vicinamibacterales bacterium]
MKSGQSQPAPSHSFDEYKKTIDAHVADAQARLDDLQAKAKQTGAQVEASAITNLNAAKQNIDRKVQDLKATTSVNMARAKADIDADVQSFKAAVNDFEAKHTTTSTRK